MNTHRIEEQLEELQRMHDTLNTELKAVMRVNVAQQDSLDIFEEYFLDLILITIELGHVIKGGHEQQAQAANDNALTD